MQTRCFYSPTRRTTMRLFLLGALLALVFTTPRATQAAPQALTLTVNRTDDIAPRGTGSTCLTPASSDCSLREAVIKANANPGSTIVFASSINGTPITLTIPGDENAAAQGDLDVTANVTILGNGSANTIIQAGTNNTNGIDKVFALNPNCTDGVSVTISGVTIRYGWNATPVNTTTYQHTGGGLDWCGSIGGAFTLSDSVISDNTAVTAYGGGLNIDAATGPTGVVAITNTTFQNNKTLSTSYTANGGGINIQGNQISVNISKSTFADNAGSASSAGGAIYIAPSVNSTITIADSTFSGNNASAGGGGIYIWSGIVTLTNDTLAGNSAPSGGGIFKNAGTVTLRNTIVASSTSGGNCSGTIIDGNGNLVWGDTTCPGTNADPKLGALADNGGSTQTMKLGSDSAAIDAAVAANCPGTDQRGETRDDLQCDTGAYELKLTDSRTVQRSISSSALTTFGPALMGLQYSGTNPGTTAVTKNSWKIQGAESIASLWVITPTVSTGLNLTMKLCYSLAELGSLTENNLRFYRFNSGAWSQVGGAPALSTVGSNHCASISGITDLSRWTLATSTPTAVELSSLKAQSPVAWLHPLAGLVSMACIGLFLFVKKRPTTGCS